MAVGNIIASRFLSLVDDYLPKLSKILRIFHFARLLSLPSIKNPKMFFLQEWFFVVCVWCVFFIYKEALNRRHKIRSKKIQQLVSNHSIETFAMNRIIASIQVLGCILLSATAQNNLPDRFVDRFTVEKKCFRAASSCNLRVSIMST